MTSLHPSRSLTIRILCSFAAVLVILALPAARAAGVTVKTSQDAHLGLILTDANGMTLYVFDKDETNKSNCTGGCAQAWPPFRVSADASGMPAGIPGVFGAVDRGDGGAPQATYNGKPLYTYAKDTAPGDTTGQDVGEVWYVANIAPTVSVSTTPLGDILVGPGGLTLYSYAKDEPNKSNCSGGCLAAWPALLVADEPLAPDGLEGKLDTIKRDDGGLQVTYNGMPLYYWQNDKKPGDTTGQGVGNVWFVVKDEASTAAPNSMGY